MNISSLLHILIITACLCLHHAHFTSAGSIHGINRSKCDDRNALQKYQDLKEVTERERRIQALRSIMRDRAHIDGKQQIDAYIVTTFDEHHNHQEEDVESRLQYISGFTGPIADAVVTEKSAALWTESKYIELADQELDCEWKIFIMGEEPKIATWLSKQLQRDKFVGADPKTIPHELWREWERELNGELLGMLKVKNLIDKIGGLDLKSPRNVSIKPHNSSYTGVHWRKKIEQLREHLRAHRCDAMVVTSLTEIAYLLNLRGGDFRYIPVFKAYVIVAQDVYLYTNISKISGPAELMMNYILREKTCQKQSCVIIKPYDVFWEDLNILSRLWKRVLLPSMSVFDMGVSEAIHSNLTAEKILERPSPIVYMRAQKNEVEREGMRRAHVRDAVALCDTLSYLDERFMHGDQWTELTLAKHIDIPRVEQKFNKGMSFKTVVAFGPNAAKSYYLPSNLSNADITDRNLILIDSGGQYFDGTTSVARTIHLGEPTPEQKRAYTNILMGMIRLSMLAFPESLKPAELDTLIREPLWSAKEDYPHISGSGIGSYLNVEESPIYISYTTKHKNSLKDGYFFSVAPGYYKENNFGIRLKNVFEVITSDRIGFLEIRVTTLMPFATKLIDRTMLSLNEKKWLNNYNARIREVVGDELKRQFKMPTFYWLMNQTEHIREYLTEEEYRKSFSNRPVNLNYFLIITLIVSLKSLFY